METDRLNVVDGESSSEKAHPYQTREKGLAQCGAHIHTRSLAQTHFTAILAMKCNIFTWTPVGSVH